MNCSPSNAFLTWVLKEKRPPACSLSPALSWAVWGNRTITSPTADEAEKPKVCSPPWEHEIKMGGRAQVANLRIIKQSQRPTVCKAMCIACSECNDRSEVHLRWQTRRDRRKLKVYISFQYEPCSVIFKALLHYLIWHSIPIKKVTITLIPALLSLLELREAYQITQSSSNETQKPSQVIQSKFCRYFDLKHCPLKPSDTSFWFVVGRGYGVSKEGAIQKGKEPSQMLRPNITQPV